MDKLNEQNRRVTGYRIYNKEARERTKINSSLELYPNLPEKKYDIIYADPPWHYNGKLQFDKSSTSKEKLDPNRNIFISSSSFKYPTVKTKDLMSIPIQKICKDDCLLFMWATNPHLAQAISLGEAWGFEYKTVAFIWDKMNHNPGQYTLSNCELCLVFKKGRIPKPRGVRNIQQLVRSPRRAHSMKPDEIRLKIVEMFPTQEKIELFSRGRFTGWDEWGLEISEYMAENFSLTNN